MIHFKIESTRACRLQTTFQSFRRNFSIYSLLMLLCILFACDKQEEIQTDSLKPIQIRSVTSAGDRIYFAEFEDFLDYYEELESLYESDLDAFDSILLADSPVQTINDLYAASLDYSTFLADPIMRGILNPNYEFQIGDAIIAYMNNEEVLVFDEGNSSAKSAIRGLTKNEPIDIGEIPEGAYWGKPYELEEAISIGCGCDINILPWTDCENIRVWGRCNNFWGNDGDGDVWVDFSFPGTVRILDEEVSGNFEFFINTNAVAVMTNDGSLLATADPTCQLAQNKTDFFAYDPAIFAGCDLFHKTESEVIVDGRERMKIETSFYYNNFSKACHRGEVRSESRPNLLTEDWSSSKAELDVEVDANWNNLVCDYLDDGVDDGHCNSCRGIARVVRFASKTVSHCTDDLIGDYRKERNNTVIDEVQNVEFDCCFE